MAGETLQNAEGVTINTTVVADNSDTCLTILHVLSFDPQILLLRSYPADTFPHLHNIKSINKVLLNNLCHIHTTE